MQSSKLFFSIIIPTLNEEKFLPRLLNRLKRQKEKDFEVIIVDGNSKDTTVQKAKSYKNSLPNLKIIISSRQNVAYQRNLGAEKARGKFLVFLDADSTITFSFLSKLKKTIQKNPGLIYLPRFAPDIRTPDNLLLFEIANFLIEISQYTSKPFSSGGQIIFRKEIFEIIGGFDENLSLSEDHELIRRARKYGIIAKTLPEIKVTISLRRMQKEGRLKFFLKYLYTSAQTLVSDKVTHTIIPYDMGGHLYRSGRKRKNGLEKLINKNFKKLQTLIQRTLKTLS